MTYMRNGKSHRLSHIIYFEGSKRPKWASRAQNEIWGPKQYGRVMYPSFGNFTRSKKKYTYRSQKGENRHAEPKNGI
jgi:hypothetical protein